MGRGIDRFPPSVNYTSPTDFLFARSSTPFYFFLFLFPLLFYFLFPFYYIFFFDTGLATLSSIGLRQPENCVAIVAKHGVPLILTAMQRLPNSVNVQRSGCLALRNLVSRNKEHVDVILGAGAEDVVLACRLRHPACNDVAFAALRDLGCAANYKKPEDMEREKREEAHARKGFQRC